MSDRFVWDPADIDISTTETGDVTAESPAPHPGSAERLHEYWVHGPGAAKIRWGTPGDHNRCVRELVDDAHFTPEQAHGYCITGSARVLPARVVVPVGEPVTGPHQVAAAALAGPLGRFAGPELRGAYDRDYAGEIILLKVASGHELAITPNHPVATCRGWVPAAKLAVGDHVLCGTGREWDVDGVDPDVDDIPPAIEQVAKALPFRHVAVAEAEHFHGDGAGSDVYEFAPAGGLLLDDRDAPVAEHPGEFMFSGRDVPRAPMRRGTARTSQLDALAGQDRVDAADRGTVTAGDHDGGFAGLVPVRDGLVLPCQLCRDVAVAVGGDPVTAEYASDGGTVTPVEAADCGGGLPAGVAPQYVVHLGRERFEGHVYNLATASGGYFAESILVHNCNLAEKAATGLYPAQHAKLERGGKKKATAEDPEVAAVGPKGYSHGWVKVGGLEDVNRRLTELPDLIGVGGQQQSPAERRLAATVGDIQDELGSGVDAADWEYIRGKIKDLAAAEKDATSRGDQGDSSARALAAELSDLRDALKALGGQGRTSAAADTPALPSLITIPGVDILAAGTWQLSSGRQTFTRADLTAAADAAACPAVGPPVIKIGHLDDRFTPDPSHDGEPAIGKVTNLRADPTGNKLIGDMAGMPGWLGAVAASAFPRRSVEGTYNFPCQIGHTHPFVVTAVALLGVTPPGVGVLGGLDDIAALYGLSAAAAAGGWRTGPADQEGHPMAVTEEDVRRAFYAQGSSPPSWWITELQMEPTQLIVADEQTTKVYRVPFTLSGSGVTFGAPEEFATYTDVAAARGTGPLVVFASAAESRAVTAAWDAAAAQRNLGDNPSSAQIKALYALPGDTKSASSLPHHDVAPGGKVGAANPQGCSAAIGALNGARGGVKGASPAAKKAAYSHLAAHLKAAGQTPPDLQAAAVTASPVPADLAGEDLTGWVIEDQTGDPPDEPIEAAGAAHGACSTTHDHPHPAMGAQGSDATHTHTHTHNNDAAHNHDHNPMSAAPAAKEGAVAKMDFTDEQLAQMRAKLGKKDGEDLTAADIAAAFAAPPVTASGDGPPKPREGSGMYLVDSSILEDYQTRAKAGDEAVHRLHIDERDTILATAVRDGKFPQARLEHYKLRWNSDPDGTRNEVAHLAAGLVPVGGPVGTPGVDPDLPGDSFEDQMAYRKLYPEEVAASKAARRVREGI